MKMLREGGGTRVGKEKAVAAVGKLGNCGGEEGKGNGVGVVEEAKKGVGVEWKTENGAGVVENEGEEEGKDATDVGVVEKAKNGVGLLGKGGKAVEEKAKKVDGVVGKGENGRAVEAVGCRLRKRAGSTALLML